MDLQKKTLIVLVTFLILAVTLTGLFVTVILLTNYQTLEKEYVTNDLMRTVSQLNNDEQSLSALALDWAPRDETYAYVTSNQSDFIRRNINSDAFVSRHVSFMVITNRAGNVIYAGRYARTNGSVVPVSANLLEQIQAGSPLLDMSNPRGEITGILLLPEGPALITSHPVVRTDFSGTPEGVVIMGQYLGHYEVQRLSDRMPSAVEIQKINQSDLSRTDLASVTSTSGTPVIVRPVNESTVAGYAILEDIYGNPAIIVKITEPRDFYQEGVSTIFQFILILLVNEMLFGFIMIFFLDRAVLSRIKALSLQVRNVGTRSDPAVQVTFEGDDELADLAREINAMLDKIEKTHADLISSETRFHDLSENTSDILFTLDTTGKIQYVSSSVNRYGYLVEEVLGQDFSRFIYLRERTRVMLEFNKQIAECVSLDLTIRVVDKWGFIHWMETKSTISMNVYGKAIGVNGVMRDFTDRKRAEEAIVLANRKLNLLTNITRHDILNTITALLGCVDMAKATTDPAERAELLDEIKDRTRVIQRQIEFTREYESVGVNAPLWQNIQELIHRAMLNFAGAGVAISADVEDTEVYADPLLEKVFYNLIDNAIRYGEHLTEIRFYYQISDVGLTLICEDDGEGIPEKEKESIFERGIGKNTGMGLFLSREILAITGISIRETGTPKRGARFEMQIPNSAIRFIRRSNHKPKE